MIRVLIADDHHLVRQGIRALLEKNRDIEVIGEAKNGLEALALTSQLHPEVLVIDVNMPHINGIDVIRDVTSAGMKTACVILSMYSDESLVKRAFQNGALGYLLKNSIAEDLITAIEAVNHHQIYLSPELKDSIATEEITNIPYEPEPTAGAGALTNREREICQLVAQGLTNHAIANSLSISVKTVEKHRANLMLKLGVQDLAGLIREAIRQGIIFLEE
jgi:DNA-binding NarL/FixJ family response regulator